MRAPAICDALLLQPCPAAPERALMHPCQIKCLQAEGEVDELHSPAAAIQFRSCGRQVAADCQCGALALMTPRV